MKKRLTNTHAITLIALVITIVVLIILAAVAINLSLGNNGIFIRAKTAKEKYQNAESYEKKEISTFSNEIDNYTSFTRGTSNINYSKEEQNTGLKWIDGKPIYQRTIDVGSQTAKNTYFSKNLSADYNINNVDKAWVIQSYGMYNYNGNSWGILSLPTANASVYIEKDSICFTSSNYLYSFKDICATIQYTKTTD